MKRICRLGLLGLFVLSGSSSCSSNDPVVKKDIGAWREGGPVRDGGARRDTGGTRQDTGAWRDTGGTQQDTGGAKDADPPKDAGGTKGNWLICTADSECTSGVCGYNMGCLNDENGQKADSSLGKRCLPSSAYPRENSSDGKCQS